MRISKSLDSFLAVLFVIGILAMVGAAILQIFIPSFLGSSTEYGLNPGWQREIGIWNLGLIATLIGTLLKGSLDTVKIVSIGAIVIGVGFGTNHLVGYLVNTQMYMNLLGAIENYIFAVLIIIGITRKFKKQ